MRDSIRQRKDEDLTPVSPSNVPNELLPLIDAINYHMGRLGKLLQSRRRFLADAAHRSAPPLTRYWAPGRNGQRQGDPEEMRRTFASVVGTIRSTHRMANQMLTLARAEPANGQIQEAVRLDFAGLVCEAAGELAMLAQKKNIDLSVEGSTLSVFIDGNATMLKEMVSNVVDNALRYTPEHGHVTLEIAAAETAVVLRIVDDGPGIPEAERDKVFQRFYRILGHGDADGSDLGLAIVREICWAHRGQITLGDGKAGHGLAVEIILPAARPLQADHVALIALFQRRAFAAEHLAAIALEPFFDLGGVAMARRRGRDGDGFDSLAGRRAPGAARAVAMATGARRRFRFAAGKFVTYSFSPRVARKSRKMPGPRPWRRWRSRRECRRGAARLGSGRASAARTTMLRGVVFKLFSLGCWA